MPVVLHCHICDGHDFNSSASLARHYYQVHSAAFCCQYCNQQFSTVQGRDTHLGVKHASPACFPCIFCDVRKRQKKELTYHQKENHPNQLKEFTCGECNMLMLDRDCLNVHKEYCRGKQQQQQQQQHPKQEAEARAHHSRSPCLTSGTPNSNSTVSSTISFVCQYCSQQFTNREDHCRHLISAHQAGVMCSYCNHQFAAPPGVQDAALSVFRDHLDREHKAAGRWVCIYCNMEFGVRQDMINHQADARHRIITCHLCAALMPSYTVSRLHKEFQHTVVDDAVASVGGASSQLEGLCLCCFQRCALGNLRQHLLQHAEQEFDLISCNECFEFVSHPIAMDKHSTCFELEAKRFVAFVAGEKATYTLCYCGFCANNQQHLSRHHGWCHKELKCPSCGEIEFGYIGMKQHMCIATPQGKLASTSQIPNSASASGQHHQSSSTHQRESLDSAPRLRSRSFTDGSLVSAQPALPVPTASAVADSATAMELPDSSEEVVIKEENGDGSTMGQLTNEEAVPNDTMASTVTKNQSVQGTVRPMEESTSSSSSPSSSDDEKKKSKMPLVPKKLAAKRGPMKNAMQSKMTLRKRPRVHPSKPVSHSSSSSSSDSESEQERATKPKPPNRAQGASVQLTRPMSIPNRDSSSSSSSSPTFSSDEEPAQKNRCNAPYECGRSTKPKITATFSVKNTEATAKRKSMNAAVLKPPAARQNIFSAAANTQKASIEVAAENGQARRRHAEEIHSAADLEYICTLCNQLSVYRGNVIRHLEMIHRLRPEMCQGFCQCRERPRPAILEEEQQGRVADQRPETRSVAAEVKKGCSDCKAHSKKAQQLEKILVKMTKQLHQARKVLEGEQDD